VANPNYLITTAKGTFTITAADTFNWTAHYVDGDGHQVADPVSGTDLHAGDAYKTTAKYVDGYYLTAEPANATGTIKAGDVTVTYVYHKVGSFTVTSPSGQTTTIAYSVDHDDPTKVAAPAGQVVPYVKGYDAIGPDGKLTLVDPADPTQGYVLPAITQAGQPTAITYVAVNNGGNGGNSGNSGNNTNDNQASGTVTPTTNNAGTTTNQTNNETNSTPVTTDQTASQSSNQKKSTTAKQTKPAARAAQKQATGKQAVQKRATAAKANGKTGQSTISRNAATLKPGRSALANQSGKQGVSAAKLGSTNRSGQAPSGQSQVETATMLPQTGDASSTTLTWLGAMLAGFLGLFGLKRRRRG
jgi:LPXTG-motif cell wall-anchored protein